MPVDPKSGGNERGELFVGDFLCFDDTVRDESGGFGGGNEACCNKCFGNWTPVGTSKGNYIRCFGATPSTNSGWTYACAVGDFDICLSRRDRSDVLIPVERVVELHSNIIEGSAEYLD